MKFRDDISVKRQISMIPFIAFLGFFVMLAFEYQSSQTLLENNATVISQLAEIRHVREIQGDVSMLRTHEKEYLRGQSQESLTGVYTVLAKIRARIRTIQKDAISAAESQTLSKWSTSLNDYQDQFTDMSNELMSIGFSENMGIRGTMRKAIHTVEQKLKSGPPSLYLDLLQLRRHEKDFLLRHDPKYSLLWERSVLRMKLDIAQKLAGTDDSVIVSQTFQRYIDSFHQLQQHLHDLRKDRTNVNDISNGLLTVMTSVFNHSSGKLALAANQNYDDSITNFKRLALATAFVGAIAFIAARLIGNGISAPLHNISQAMQRLADGVLDTEIPARGHRNEFGEMAESVEIFRDDARRRVMAEQLLNSAKTHTENIIKSMTDALLEVSPDGNIRTANPAAGILLGTDPEDLIGRKLGDFVQEESTTTKDYGILKLIQSGLEDHHSRDQRRFYALLQNAPLPLAIADGTAKITFANKIACEMFGFSPDEMVGMAVENLMPKSTRAPHHLHVDTYSKETEPRSMLGGTPMTAVNANGETIETAIGLMPLSLAGEQRIMTVFHREGIDPHLAEISDTDFGKLFAGFDLDPRILHLLPSGSGETSRAHTFKTLTGDTVPVRVSGNLLHGETCEDSGAIFVARDVSEQLAHQTELLQFKSMLDRLASKVYMFDPDTLKLRYFNRSAGRRIQQIDKITHELTPMDIDPTLSETGFRNRLQPLIDGTQVTVTFETEQPNPDGTITPEEVVVQLITPADSDPRFLIFVRDITDRKKSEKQILLFKQALDASQDQVYMFHPETMKVAYMNESGRQKTGWKKSEIKTHTVMDTQATFDRAEFDKIAAPLMSGEKQSVTYENTDKDGVPIEITLQILKPKNQQARFVIYARDITERKQIEEAKSQFISTISHELRTPLTSIKGALGLLKAGAAGELNDKAGSLIGIALGNSDRLIRLINDILDFEKIEAGKMDFRMEDMDLAEMIRHSVEANRSYGVKNNVKFTMRGVKNPIMVKGDSDRLMQVMANLLSNAAKFSDNGGTVTVTATRKANGVRVAVKDTGAGIPQKAQATIFDKFTQADSSDQRAKGGTGLGLNIVKMMLTAHESEIDFVSIEGKGTTFFFDIALTEPEQGQMPVPQPENITPLPIARNGRLLICEDDSDVAALLKIMLEHEGYETQFAHDAATAKKLLKSGDFDGMTLDLGLPDQDGISFLHELRATPEFEALPVVVVSASARKNKAKLEGNGVGVVDWIQKPIDQNCLKGLMRRLIKLGRAERPKILHVEDEKNIREIVEGIVEDRADVTGASSVFEARKRLKETRFDLVILDLTLPDGSGEDLLPLLNRAPQNATPALIFSAREARAGAASGVQAALVKSRASNEELLNVINAVIEGGRTGHRTAAE